jgi:hypothetical protein
MYWKLQEGMTMRAAHGELRRTIGAPLNKLILRQAQDERYYGFPGD